VTATFETERLLLRPHREDDLGAMLAYHSLPEVSRYLYGQPRTEAEVRDLLERRMNADAPKFAVELRSTGGLVGEVGLNIVSEEHRQGEVGFIFDPRHHGHGYATEAARVIVDLGFRELGLHRIIGRLDARNAASARVLEKLGMRREAHLVENEWVKGEWQSELVYAVLAAEWDVSRAGS
jgi:RimJ/RimL family protein N-acetyltransferase